jgi:hypothetical protein
MDGDGIGSFGRINERNIQKSLFTKKNVGNIKNYCEEKEII